MRTYSRARENCTRTDIAGLNICNMRASCELRTRVQRSETFQANIRAQNRRDPKKVPVVAEASLCDQECIGRPRTAAQDTDNRKLLLCASRKRRLGRNTAEQRDKLAPFHSITSSASASSLSGIWRPSAFAVLRLMINSTRGLLNRQIGRLRSLRIFPLYMPALR